MRNDILRSYNIPSEIIKFNNDGLLMNYNYTISSVYQTINSFDKFNEKKLIEYLYNAYKDTDVFRVYILSKEEFTRFLYVMLPKYVRGER